LSVALARPAAGLKALDRAEAEAGLAGFIKRAWHVLEPPGRPYVHNWHIDSICEHLEAVSDGGIRRLLINMPPGCMKSLSVSVCWPAWEWGPRGRPGTRWIGASYAERLSVRDNIKCRRLIRSDWYRALWGDAFDLVREQNTKARFENDRTGFRLATSVGGLGTGERGDRFIIDDPHNVQKTDSATTREATLRWFDETVPTRLNDPEKSAIVVVMQRVHERDVSGHILARELDYEHLLLPMEYEAATSRVMPTGTADPRTADGELLWPARFSGPVVEALKRSMGAYAAAGQLQQRPVPREGGLFRRHWFDIVRTVPGGVRAVRHWDLAGSRAGGGRDPDWTVGLKLCRDGEGIFYVEDIVRLRAEGPEVRKAIAATAARDGTGVRISLPQDPGQAGKVQAQDLVRMLAGYRVTAKPESGDKLTRAEPAAAQAEAGNLKLRRGDWNDAFLEEAAMFPNGAHKDQVDALSGAFAALMSERERWFR
jgi:predicted phage terminase large subunit-like protein